MAPRSEPVLHSLFKILSLGFLVSGTLAFFLHVGRLTFYLGEIGRTGVLAVELGVVAASSIMTVCSRRYGAAFLLVCLSGYVIFQAELFSHNFRTDVNLNSQSIFFGWFSVVTFSSAFFWQPHARVLKTLYVITIAYAVFYCLLSLHVPGLLPSGNSPDTISIASDAAIGRPARFMILAGPLTFGLFYSYCKFAAQRDLRYLFPLGLCIFDVYISYFRTIALVIIFVFALHAAFKSTRIVGIMSSLTLFVVMCTLLIGLFFPDFQPFAVFGSRDGSAIIRGLSYEGVRSYARDHWLLGVGFASSAGDVIYIMSTNLFFSADLGAVGVFHDAGVVGLILFATLSLLIANSSTTLKCLDIAQWERDALSLTGAACALFGVIAPDLWSGTSTIFVGLFLATWLLAIGARRSHSGSHWHPRARQGAAEA